jgi:predicted Zn-dependent peptidase
MVMKKTRIEKADVDIFSYTYKNGFRIFLAPDPTVNFYYMTLTSKFGSIYTKFKREDEENYIEVPNGVAHFLEHLTFKTEDGDAMEYFSKLSANANAYTTYDLTCYEVDGVTDFDKCLNYLLTYVSTPYYTEELVENEKPIICEEIKSHIDRPTERAIKKFRENIFDKLNYKYDICGTEEDVNNTTVDDIKNAYDYFYNPSNLFLVVTGNFDKEKCKELVDKHEISQKVCNTSKVEIFEENEDVKVVKEKEIIKDEVPNTILYMATKIKMSKFDSLNLEEPYVNSLINLVLDANFGVTADFTEYVIDNNLIDSDRVNASSSVNGDIKVCYYSAPTSKPGKLFEEIKNKINNLTIDEDTFNRKKRVELSSIILGGENPYKVNSATIRRIIDYDKLYENYYSGFESLSLDKAKKVCELLSTSDICEVILEPKS